MIQPEYFPIMGIRDFHKNGSERDILFNNLQGERLIDHPHKHDFFVINIFKSGKGNHSIDFVEYGVENLQIHMVLPEQVHQWNIAKETVGYQLMISKNWFENLVPYLRFSPAFYQTHPVINLSKKDFKPLLYEFKAIQKQLKSNEVFWEIVQKRCEVISLLVSKSAENNFHHEQVYGSHPVVSRFINLINFYFKEQRQVSFYAEKLNISANYLNVLCKKNIKESASSLIQHRILLEAKRLLKVSEMSVKDIVFELGFYDQASFSKFFKSHTGMTPSQFKE